MTIQKKNYNFEDRLYRSSDSYDKYFTSSDEYKNRKYQKNIVINARDYEHLLGFY